MVPEYFGLKEAGFSITPDPQFLYLSPRHQEALAHLLYGAGEGGGFVLLTGEVGTGKTTICRAFLEQLPEHVDLALILNPALDVPELLHAVCDEFGVPVTAEEKSPKPLVDRLNAYLLEAHGNGRRPVLMIDEAQNLSPEVLEQIRLLTNLETAKHKLLQIFLVGQPELHDLLQRRDLRQLAQRITARYHLMPLDAGETDAYIQHRLAVAGARQRLFRPAAVRRIHRLTGGVPRLINILCERALLGAYAGHVHQVDRRIVGQAWRELNSRPAQRRRIPLPAMAILLLLSIGSGAWLILGGAGDGKTVAGNTKAPIPPTSTVNPALLDTQPAPEPSTNPVPAPASAAEETTRLPDPEPEAAPEPAAANIPPPDPLLQPDLAHALLFRQWALPAPASGTEGPCPHARRLGLRCREGDGGWDALASYARPALIPLNAEDGGHGLGLVIGLDAQRVLLAHPDGDLILDKAELQERWNGDFLLLWRPAPGDRRLLGPDSPPEAQQWLRQTLATIPALTNGLTHGSGYDDGLRNTVTAFQHSQGLDADGIVGPETLIRLNTVTGRPDIPHLKREF